MRLGPVAVVVVLGSAACVGPRGPTLPRPSLPLSATPEQPFRRDPPEPAAPPPFAPPAVEVHELQNGLTVMLLRRPGAPAATVTLATRLGGEDGPHDRAGDAWFLGEVLTTGASSGSPRGSHPLERRGLTPEVRVGRDRARLTVRVPAHRIEELLPLMARIVASPSPGDEDVEEMRRDALSRIRGVQGTPADRAWYHSRLMLYGEGHRRAAPIYGSEERIRVVTREELLELHGRSWVPSESVLVVAGDITSERLRRLAAASFGAWRGPSGLPVARQPPDEDALPWRGPQLLAVPSRSRGATIMVVEHGPSRLDEDFVHCSLLAGVLGGIFASRLNLAFREERGYSYGVTAAYGADRLGGELSIQTVVAQDRVREAVLAIVAEMRRLRDSGPTEPELETARAMARQSLVGDLEVTSSAAELLADLFVDGRDPGHLAVLEAEIRAATAEGVRAAARRWLRPDEAPIVVTGELPVIETALRSTGLGPVAVEGDR